MNGSISIIYAAEAAAACAAADGSIVGWRSTPHARESACVPLETSSNAAPRAHAARHAQQVCVLCARARDQRHARWNRTAQRGNRGKSGREPQAELPGRADHRRRPHHQQQHQPVSHRRASIILIIISGSGNYQRQIDTRECSRGGITKTEATHTHNKTNASVHLFAHRNALSRRSLSKYRHHERLLGRVYMERNVYAPLASAA